MPGPQNSSASRFDEHGYYCLSASNWGPEISGSNFTTVGQDNTSNAANFYLEQRASTFAQSRENGHFRSHSASGSTSYSQGKKRARTATRCDCQARSASGSKQACPLDSSAPESQRNSQRPQNRAAPLSSSSWNLPSTSTAMNSTLSKPRKSSDDKTASGSKRFNFSQGQIAVLNGWLRKNLEHPCPSEKEKLFLARETGLTLTQVNNFYTNARRRPTYKKMCEEQGIVPVSKKKKAKILTSFDRKDEKENLVPVRDRSSNQVPVRDRSSNQVPVRGGSSNQVPGRLDSGLGSDGSRPTSASAHSSSSISPASSPPMETSSPEIEVPMETTSPETSQENAFAVDAGNNPLPLQPCQVPVFIKGSGFPPAPPLPADASPEELAVSRQVADSVPLRRRMWQAFLSVAEMYHDVDVKGYKRNLPPENYEAEELMARTSSESKEGVHKSSIPSARSPQMETSSPETEASQDHVFVVDAGCNPLQMYPCQVPISIRGSGFPPAPPLPADARPEMLAVSGQVADDFYVDVPTETSLMEVLSYVAEKHPDADVKAQERNLSRAHYIAEELMAGIPGAIIPRL